MRGDNAEVPVLRRRKPGSPPRAWGQRFFGEHYVVLLTDHPHVRGDNGFYRSAWRRAIGSPPRAWGQQNRDPLIGGCLRITPTCVGTTSLPWHLRPDSKDHPHVRGDNCGFMAGRRPVKGSPPRAWGQQIIYCFPIIGIRITPTCVGTTSNSL